MWITWAGVRAAIAARRAGRPIRRRPADRVCRASHRLRDFVLGLGIEVVPDHTKRVLIEVLALERSYDRTAGDAADLDSAERKGAPWRPWTTGSRRRLETLVSLRSRLDGAIPGRQRGRGSQSRTVVRRIASIDALAACAIASCNQRRSPRPTQAFTVCPSEAAARRPRRIGRRRARGRPRQGRPAWAVRRGRGSRGRHRQTNRPVTRTP